MDSQPDRRRQGLVLELGARIPKLEPTEGGRGPDPLFEGLVGLDNPLPGLFGDEHIPVRRPVGLDPTEGRRTGDDHRVGGDVLLGPLELGRRDADVVDVEQILFVHVGPEGEVRDMHIRVFDRQVQTVLVEEDVVVELETDDTARQVELEEMRHRLP